MREQTGLLALKLKQILPSRGREWILLSRGMRTAGLLLGPTHSSLGDGIHDLAITPDELYRSSTGIRAVTSMSQPFGGQVMNAAANV